jgi:hypothetical protein
MEVKGMESDLGETLYVARWDTVPKPVIVILRMSRAILSGQNYDVEVCDQSGRRISAGLVHADAQESPYCLVEIRTNCADLPPLYRHTWILGIAFLFHEDAAKFDRRNPIQFVGRSRDEDPQCTPLYFEPIEWGDDANRVRKGIGILNGSEVEVRPAETFIGEQLRIKSESQ